MGAAFKALTDGDGALELTGKAPVSSTHSMPRGARLHYGAKLQFKTATHHRWARSISLIGSRITFS